MMQLLAYLLVLAVERQPHLQKRGQVVQEGRDL